MHGEEAEDLRNIMFDLTIAAPSMKAALKGWGDTVTGRGQRAGIDFGSGSLAAAHA